MGHVLTGDQLRTALKRLGDIERQLGQKEYPHNPEEMLNALQAVGEGKFGTMNGGYELTVSQKRAREIMGRNIFGVEEAVKHFGVNPSRQQLAVLSEIPFTEEALQSCKDTHVLVAVFPLSILDIRGQVSRVLFYRHDDAWYNEQAFARDKGEVSWQLIRKTPVANSTGKNWNEQQKLLTRDETTPTARVIVYTIIGHYLATGEQLFRGLYVRCSDVYSLGYRVCVGFFVETGLVVDGHWDDYRFSSLGLASSRKPAP